MKAFYSRKERREGFAFGGSESKGEIMTKSAPLPILSFSADGLSGRKPTRFKFLPTAAERAAMAAQMGLIALNDLKCHGEITPFGHHDFHLTAEFNAKIIQPCSITLAPVPATVSDSIDRRFIRDFKEPEEEEAEMMDETAEPMPKLIDIVAIVMESLTLAMPLYPRAPNAELGEAVFAAPSVAPLMDADLKPFASLAALAIKMKTDENPNG